MMAPAARAAVVVLAALALPACGSASPAGSLETPDVLAGLCRAQAAAEPARAEEHFAGVHGPLHQLASDVERRDRAVAGDLLRAKRGVEAALEGPSPTAAALSRELSPLIDAVRDALRTLGRPAAACGADHAERG